MTLHMLLSHSVPAWVLVALVVIFTLYETYRLIVQGHSEALQRAWMEHASEHLKTHKSSIEIVRDVTKNLGGGEHHKH